MKDPTSWGTGVPITTPNRYYLSSVAPGAAVAIGQNIDRHGLATPLLRSTDGGRTWIEETTFRSLFPEAWAWTASRAAGLDVVVGTTITQSSRPGAPAAWLSASTRSWSRLPTRFDDPTLPTTSIPQLPPAGALNLVASLGNRIVMMGSDAQLDRFYAFDVKYMSS
jgi:hypothetical protein